MNIYMKKEKRGMGKGRREGRGKYLFVVSKEGAVFI